VAFQKYPKKGRVHSAEMMRRVKHWISGAVVVTFAGTMFVVVLYVSFMSNVAGYNDYVACNPGTGITRIEWFLGVRPTENDCWPLHG
jgi:hypothetical protein